MQYAKADVPSRVDSKVVLATLDGTSVRDIMRPVVVSLRPDVDLETAGSLLLSFDFDALPVVDDAGRPIGRLALRDVVREVVESATWQPTTMRVAQLMSRDLELIPESASIVQAAAGLAGAPTATAVVVSRSGELVGTLCAADILAWLAARGGQRVLNERNLLQLPVGIP